RWQCRRREDPEEEQHSADATPNEEQQRACPVFCYFLLRLWSRLLHLRQSLSDSLPEVRLRWRYLVCVAIEIGDDILADVFLAVFVRFFEFTHGLSPKVWSI